MMPSLQIFTQADISARFTLREGEVKLGQTMPLLDPSLPLSQALVALRQQGVRFILMGIAEDIGPQANLGRTGATEAYDACLSQLLNLQSNRFFNGIECAVLGVIKAEGLPQQNSSNSTEQVNKLRQLVPDLDQVVIDVTSQIIASGLEPIVVGGGHNNAYGLLSAVKASTGRPVAAVNLDPHADFRPREGRHSGNGFSYAAATGALTMYHVLGLHEQKNSESSLQQLEAFGGTWHSLQQVWITQETPLAQALDNIADKLNSSGLPVAIELDLDAISKMPSSASSFAGIPLLDACKYVNHIAAKCQSQYLHLAEAAPACHDAGITAGTRDVGQAIAELILAYVKARI